MSIQDSASPFAHDVDRLAGWDKQIFQTLKDAGVVENLDESDVVALLKSPVVSSSTPRSATEPRFNQLNVTTLVNDSSHVISTNGTQSPHSERLNLINPDTSDLQANQAFQFFQPQDFQSAQVSYFSQPHQPYPNGYTAEPVESNNSFASSSTQPRIYQYQSQSNVDLASLFSPLDLIKRQHLNYPCFSSGSSSSSSSDLEFGFSDSLSSRVSIASMNTGNGTYINTPSSAKVAREAKLKMPTPLSKRSSVFTSHPPNVPVSFNYDSNFASAFVRAQISQPVSSNMLQQQSGGYSSANVMANSQGNMKAYKGLNNTGNSRGSTFRAPSGVSFSIGSGSSTGTPASQPSTPVFGPVVQGQDFVRSQNQNLPYNSYSGSSHTSFGEQFRSTGLTPVTHDLKSAVLNAHSTGERAQIQEAAQNASPSVCGLSPDDSDSNKTMLSNFGNDYNDHFVHTGIFPQTHIQNAADPLIGYPRLQTLHELKAEHTLKYACAQYSSRLSLDTMADTLQHWAAVDGLQFDVVLVGGCYKASSYESLLSLPIFKLTPRPSLAFILVPSHGLEDGRRALEAWGFRRSENISYLTLSKDSIFFPHQDSNSVLISSTWHCLMGLKGTLRRSDDNDLINCNVNTDCIIEPSEETPQIIPHQFYSIIENFSLMSRRIHIVPGYAPEKLPVLQRPGWVIVSPDAPENNFTPQAYISEMKRLGARVPVDPVIDSLRPRTPTKAKRLINHNNNRFDNAGSGNRGNVNRNNWSQSKRY